MRKPTKPLIIFLVFLFFVIDNLILDRGDGVGLFLFCISAFFGVFSYFIYWRD